MIRPAGQDRRSASCWQRVRAGIQLCAAVDGVDGSSRLFVKLFRGISGRQVCLRRELPLDASDSPVRVLTKLRESANCEVVATFRVIGIGRFMNLDHVVVPGPGCADHGRIVHMQMQEFPTVAQSGVSEDLPLPLDFFVVMMEGDVVGGFNRGDHGARLKCRRGCAEGRVREVCFAGNLHAFG